MRVLHQGQGYILHNTLQAPFIFESGAKRVQLEEIGKARQDTARQIHTTAGTGSQGKVTCKSSQDGEKITHRAQAILITGMGPRRHLGRR